MSKFLGVTKAIITRLVFAAHGFIAIWQVTTFKKNPLYWYLCSPIVLLFFEGLFTLTIKANQEWKWFCPSVFLYLGSIVPSIWLLELDKVDRRLQNLKTNVNFTEKFDLKNIQDLKHLEKAFGVNFKLPDIQMSTEMWVTLIEQFLMLILIVGRWMLPKGDLTRDQLSQLLLVYIGTAADIIEFFESYKEDRVARERLLVYLTLGIWSWSLMQFTVVLTATKSRKSKLSSSVTLGRKRDTPKTSCCNIDVWAIAINMLLQDGPFLAFRLTLIIHYKIVSYMNIFFTCKNTLVIMLQLYRFYAVQSEYIAIRKRIKQCHPKHYEISVISRGDYYGRPRKRRYEDYRYWEDDDVDDNRYKRRRNKNNNKNNSDNRDVEANFPRYNFEDFDSEDFGRKFKHKSRSSPKRRREKVVDLFSDGETSAKIFEDEDKAIKKKKSSKKTRKKESEESESSESSSSDESDLRIRSKKRHNQRHSSRDRGRTRD